MRRTREALTRAFSSLFLGRRYDEIRLGDILKEADVGRSTFYDHYRCKDDLLLGSMAGILDVLADAAIGAGEGAAFEHVLGHFWQVRDVARPFFSAAAAASARRRLASSLIDRIEARLDARVAHGARRLAVPHRLIAAHAAEGQLALIRDWLVGRASCPPGDLAEALRRSAAASLAAMR